MTNLASEFRTAFEYNKLLAERAAAQLSDEQLHTALHAETNSVAVIMKHVAGNLRSRWTDFLTADGEKPWRNRDDEFIDTLTSRSEVLADWQGGWEACLGSLGRLTADDFSREVTIRGERLSVPLAVGRSLAHCGYHAVQIVLISRILVGDGWETLTIARGGSQQHNAGAWGRQQYGRAPGA
ncbi:DinB superfamily protein [Pirellulimonas nuda]|uniref:DinB superfamily protein n=1 Tax=Pirellulimonas nuda TaxID=2528009 RepID=A0A518DCM9_9BACT|nr:DUF1572 family protein [Pirellulimonas nuda]QDU89235.1 DinB superfamily protein [Pirellulimonas nuda]